jgi:hypothetical protein
MRDGSNCIIALFDCAARRDVFSDLKAQKIKPFHKVRPGFVGCHCFHLLLHPEG